MHACPICKSEVAPRAENPSFPFCSERCKLIDLGHWLGETYRIPDRPSEQEEKPRGDRGEGGEGDDDG